MYREVGSVAGGTCRVARCWSRTARCRGTPAAWAVAASEHRNRCRQPRWADTCHFGCCWLRSPRNTGTAVGAAPARTGSCWCRGYAGTDPHFRCPSYTRCRMGIEAALVSVAVRRIDTALPYRCRACIVRSVQQHSCMSGHTGIEAGRTGRRLHRRLGCIGRPCRPPLGKTRCTGRPPAAAPRTCTHRLSPDHKRNCQHCLRRRCSFAHSSCTTTAADHIGRCWDTGSHPDTCWWWTWDRTPRPDRDCRRHRSACWRGRRAVAHCPTRSAVCRTDLLRGSPERWGCSGSG